MRHRMSTGWLLMAGCVIVSTAGCENMQRKFVRQRKTEARPSPIVGFQDYTQLIMPIDLYRKHYMMFDYWNAQLLDELSSTTAQQTNPKRLQRASEESLNELRTMRRLLQDDTGAQLDPLLDERERLARRLHAADLSSGTDAIRRALESQTREIHRQFFSRQVEDHLKSKDELHAAGY